MDSFLNLGIAIFIDMPQYEPLGLHLSMSF